MPTLYLIFFQARINPVRAKFPCVIDVVVLAAVPIFWLCYAFDQCRVISVQVANDEVQVSRVAYFYAVVFYVDLLVVCKKVLRAVHFTNNSFHGYPSNRIEVVDKARPAGTVVEAAVVEYWYTIELRPAWPINILVPLSLKSSALGVVD